MYNFKQAKEKENSPIGMGVAVFIIKDNCILLGKRLVEIGNGMYALPGGHVDPGETTEECGVREIKEETNLDIKDLEECGFEFSEEENFLTLYYKTNLTDDKDLKNVEPDKSEDWEWYSVDALPSPLFGNIDKLLKNL